MTGDNHPVIQLIQLVQLKKYTTMTINEILTPEAVTSDRMIPMPEKLPSCLETTTRLCSPVVKMAVAKGQFSAMGSMMKRAWFVYVDGDTHEAHFNICTVGPSGVGKQQVTQINDCWLQPLREHDKPVQERIDKYNDDCNKAGDSGKKPSEPKGSDAALYILSNSITDPALLKNAKALEADGDGRANLNLNELDLLDRVFGNHANAGQRMIAQFTSDEISAQRATAKGVSGRAKLRLNISVSTVEENVCMYFRKKDFFDGVTNRMDFSLIPRPPRSERRKIPRHGDFKDPLFLDKLKVYQKRLMEARGEIVVPKCDKLVEQLAEKTADLNELYDLDVFEDATHRALVYAWLRGCVLYVAEGMKWSKRIEEFVIWSYWYSLWSYAHVFTPYFKTVRLGISKQDLRQYGPVNLLSKVNTTFTDEDMRRVREESGKDPEWDNARSTWFDRGFITYDEQTKFYSKTDEYWRKHPKEALEANMKI